MTGCAAQALASPPADLEPDREGAAAGLPARPSAHLLHPQPCHVRSRPGQTQAADRPARGDRGKGLQPRPDGDVNRRIPVHRVGFLITLDIADRLAVELDEEVGFALRNLDRLSHGLGRVAPPPGHLRVAENLRELGLVVRSNGTQRDLRPRENLFDQAARLMPIARRRLFSDSNAYVRISLSVCPYSVM